MLAAARAVGLNGAEAAALAEDGRPSLPPQVWRSEPLPGVSPSVISSLESRPNRQIPNQVARGASTRIQRPANATQPPHSPPPKVQPWKPISATSVRLRALAGDEHYTTTELAIYGARERLYDWGSDLRVCTVHREPSN